MGSQVEPSTGGLTAPVDAADIADGSVSSTEFQYLDGVTSDLQTQLASKVDISGTPNAGEYARFADADTLEARTTAQVLADIGAANISGTPVAGQMAVFASASAIAPGKRVQGYLAHGTYSNAEQITLPYNVSGGAADGYYFARIVWRQTNDNTLRICNVSLNIVSNAVSGTPHFSSVGPQPPPTAGRVEVSGSSLRLYFSQTIACEIHIEVYSNATPVGSFAVADVVLAGTAISHALNAINPTFSGTLIVGTDPGGSESVRVGGNLRVLGNVVIPNQYSIITNTSDGSDNSMIRLCGGGANTSTRGGFVEVDGNEHTSTGKVSLAAGNVTGAKIDILTADTSRIAVNHDGTVTIDSTTLTSLRASIFPTGSIIFAGTGTSLPSGFLVADGSNVNRTTYAALFAVIGTTYGVGDGSTTFGLPLLDTVDGVTVLGWIKT